MAGTAFLPWEEWIARLLHPLAVAIRRRLHAARRKRSLAASEDWPKGEGTVFSVTCDVSNPRERIVYSYSTDRGYYSGSFWHWFDASDRRQVRIGDRVALRYCPQDPEKSVCVKFC